MTRVRRLQTARERCDVAWGHLCAASLRWTNAPTDAHAAELRAAALAYSNAIDAAIAAAWPRSREVVPCLAG